MTILDTVEARIKIAEQDVIGFFAKVNAGVKAELPVLKADLSNVLQWVEAHGTEVSGIILSVVTAVASSGVVGVPSAVITAATLLNGGAQAVNTAIAAVQQHEANPTAPTGADLINQAIAAASSAYSTFNHAKSILASPSAAPAAK